MSTAYKGVRGGTCFGEPLCPTCRNAQIIQGVSASNLTVLCHTNSPAVPIPFYAYECSKYDDKRIPSKWDFEQIAWVLGSDKRTKKIGFHSPAEWRKMRDEDDSSPVPE